MSNIVDSLKDLYVAFGGEAADVDTLTDITYVANAISALLGGDSNAMNITDALKNISAVVPSGGDEYEEMLTKFVNRSIDEISSDNITSIGPYAFYNCRNLTRVNFPNVTNVGESAFGNCTSLTALEFPNVTSLGRQAFGTCSYLTTAKFPSVTNVGVGAFYSCIRLTTLDCPSVTNVESLTFANCEKFNRFIVRTDSFVATLSNTDAFVGTRIASGTGYIYVPDDLVDDYKAATNWSDYASQIKPISELEE